MFWLKQNSILNYALTLTPLNTRPTHTEREKMSECQTTLPFINGSYTNYPPSLPFQDIPTHSTISHHFSFQGEGIVHVFRALITFTFDLCLILNPDYS